MAKGLEKFERNRVVLLSPDKQKQYWILKELLMNAHSTEDDERLRREYSALCKEAHDLYADPTKIFGDR